MADSKDPRAAIVDALDLVEQAEALLAQAKARFKMATGQQPDVPYMDATTATRVERFGEVAHRHLEFIKQNGSMTLADSRAIRREMYGEDIQSTANLFGKYGSGALFWRDRPFGTEPKNDDPIRLTEEGTRIADLWRATYRG